MRLLVVSQQCWHAALTCSIACRDPLRDTPSSSGSELRSSGDQSQEHSPSSDAGHSPATAEADEEPLPAGDGQSRKLNPYSSMKKEPEKAPGIMDKVQCL